MPRGQQTCYNVKDFGAVGDIIGHPSSDDAPAIQAAIDEVIKRPEGGQIYFPAGQYRLLTTPSVHTEQHLAADLHFQGEVGRSGTKLIQQGGNIPVFSITSDVWNIVGVQMRDLSLNEGSVGLYMKNVGYCDFDNLTFQNCTQYGLYAEACGFCNFNHCWWVHLVGDAFVVQNGNVSFNGCVFGEDVGSLQCKGKVMIDGGTLYQCISKLNPNGVLDMGRAAIEVHGDAGQVFVDGANIEIEGNLINYDGANEVQISGCSIKSGNGPLITMNHQYGKWPVRFESNIVRVPQTIEMYRSHNGVEHEGISIRNNAFMGRPNVAVTSAVPFRGSEIAGNTFTEVVF